MRIVTAVLAPSLVAAGIGAACSAARADDPADALARVTAPYIVFVTNEVSGDVTAIDPESNRVVATVALGKRPRGIRVSPDGTRLFVALSGSPQAPPGTDESTLPPPDRAADGIGILDVRTLEVDRVLRGPQDPEQTSLSPDGRTLYIANEDKGTASVMDVAGGRTLAELEVGDQPEGVTTSPDGRVVYVTSEGQNQVAVIDTSANEVIARVKVGARPRDTAFSPDGSRAYVTSENAGTVSVIDASSHRVVDTITLPGENARPMGIVTSPGGGRLYVSTGRGRLVVAIDAASLAVLGSADAGVRPWGLAISPDGARLYSANGPSNDVTVIDAHTMAVVARIPAGQSPWGVAIAPHPSTRANQARTN